MISCAITESDGGMCHAGTAMSVVRLTGHKVRQWFPSQQQNKIILRGPYVKGPADKPFVSGEVVRALTR